MPPKKKRSKQPSYAEAVATVALNDEPTCLDLDGVSSQMTVVLVGWLWDRDAVQVASDVIEYRKKYNK